MGVAGVKAMRHFSGRTLREARSGRPKARQRRWRQGGVPAVQTGAAVELGGGGCVEAPTCAMSAPMSTRPEQCTWTCARETEQRRWRRTVTAPHRVREDSAPSDVWKRRRALRPEAGGLQRSGDAEAFAGA